MLPQHHAACRGNVPQSKHVRRPPGHVRSHGQPMTSIAVSQACSKQHVAPRQIMWPGQVSIATLSMGARGLGRGPGTLPPCLAPPNIRMVHMVLAALLPQARSIWQAPLDIAWIHHSPATHWLHCYNHNFTFTDGFTRLHFSSRYLEWLFWWLHLLRPVCPFPLRTKQHHPAHLPFLYPDCSVQQFHTGQVATATTSGEFVQFNGLCHALGWKGTEKTLSKLS